MSVSLRSLCLVLLPALLLGCRATENQAIRTGESPVPPPVAVNPDDAGRAPAASSPARSVLETEDLALTLPPLAQSDDEWTIQVTPYVWMLGMDGSATINGQESIVDESFSDILDTLNFIFEGRLEVHKKSWGKWRAMLDVTYAELEDDAEAGDINIDATTDMGLAFTGGLYRFLDEAPVDGRGGLKVDGLVGVAYTSMKVDLDLSGGLPSVDEKQDWVDPILGLRSQFQFSEKWGAMLESVIGGFEVFDGSDLVTMNTALMSRSFGPNKRLFFGWRTLGIDYDNDKGGSDKFALNIHMNGPLVGFLFSF
jgi:hypothetical protein